MKEIIKLVFVLTAISVVAGLMLASTYKATKEPIENAKIAEKLDALKLVLPPFDNDPSLNTNMVAEGSVSCVFHVARSAGQYAGTAFECASRNGYGGEIRIMVGVNSDDTVRQIKILEHSETPGLGTKIKDAPFITQFVGLSARSTDWRVDKDGGSIVRITGATVSSRAVAEAIRTRIEIFLKYRDKIAATGADKQDAAR